MDAGPTLRLICRDDDAAVARLIRTVMPEFGASGPGFAILDPEVDAMTAAYSIPRARYFVLVEGERIIGGGGIGPLANGDGRTCELRKMYFLPEARGRGLGARMLERCLAAAREFGYATCYLETLERMDGARKLYAKFGFRPLCGPMGNTGHFGCDRFYALDLDGR